MFLTQKELHKRVLHHVRKKEFHDARKAVLDALDQAEQMDDNLLRYFYLREIKEKYNLLLLQNEVKQRHGGLLNDHPKLEGYEAYEGYENRLESADCLPGYLNVLTT